jgi:hypothetical protein
MTTKKYLMDPVFFIMVQIQDVLDNRMQEGPIFKGCVNIFPIFGSLEPFEG